MAVGSNRKFSRSDVDAIIDRALEENGSIIIRRPRRKDLALIPAEKLREIDTTDYLLASSKNRRRVLEALRDARAGKGHRMTVRQLRKQAGLSE